MKVDRKVHLINEVPRIKELEEMMEFCSKYEKLYIYGAAFKQQMLLKYFDMCDVKIEGFVISQEMKEELPSYYRELPIRLVQEVVKEENVGIIIGVSEKYYNEVLPLLSKKGFADFYIVSEFNKKTIANQIRPREHNEMAFEVSLADHCNLSCQMCDHYSQLSKPSFLDFEQYQRDIKQLGKLYNHELAYISLLGGEPLLNHDIIKIIKCTREEFPDSELIILTNGVLLLKWEDMPEGNLWETLREYNVHITVTAYPISLDYDAIREKAKEYGVPVHVSSDIHAKNAVKTVKISDKHTLNLEKSIDKFYCVNCPYFNKFNVLKNGRIYMCPVSAHSDIFNEYFNQNLELLEQDSIDIYKVDSWEDIAKFSSNYVPFCSYCDLKLWGHHSQWKPSTKQMDEYT